MNSVINKIIEIDKKAQELIEYAKKQNEELESTHASDKKEITDALAVKSVESIEVVKKTENEYADSKIEKLIKEKQDTIRMLNESYEKNHKEWEDKIFKRMLEYAE